MATIDTTDVAGIALAAHADTQLIPPAILTDVARLAFWAVFRQHAADHYHGSVKLPVIGTAVPYSITLGKLQPIFEQWFGPAPADLTGDAP